MSRHSRLALAVTAFAAVFSGCSPDRPSLIPIPSNGPTSPTRGIPPTGSPTTPTPPPFSSCAAAIPSQPSTGLILYSDWPSMGATSKTAYMTQELPEFTTKGQNCLNAQFSDVLLDVTSAQLLGWIGDSVQEPNYDSEGGKGADFEKMLTELITGGAKLWLVVDFVGDQGLDEVCKGEANNVACLYTFAKTWNAAVQATAIYGVVVNGVGVRNYAKTFAQASAAKGDLKVGLTAPLGLMKKYKNTYSADKYISLVMDFWCPTQEAYYSSATGGSAFVQHRDDLASFLTSKDSCVSDGNDYPDSPIPQSDLLQHDSDTAMVFSTRQTSSNGCLYPLRDGRCTRHDTALGDKEELGMVDPSEASNMLAALKKMYPNTQMGYYYLSFMPLDWLVVDWAHGTDRMLV